MPDTDLELAARFVAVLYTVTNGRPGQFRRIDDCAARAGITRAADLSRRKARAEWLALIPGAHEGYVSWERAEAIRRMVSDNVPTGRHHGAPKQGDALLAGLAALVAVVGYAVSAWAACPPGTAYHCYASWNGKQSCGCS